MPGQQTDDRVSDDSAAQGGAGARVEVRHLWANYSADEATTVEYFNPGVALNSSNPNEQEPNP